MDINATLFGQMLTFVLFVWFTMRFVWPLVMNALKEREEKIAQGLAAAERAKHDLGLAQEKASEQLREAKAEATLIIERANKRGNQLIEEAQIKARAEAQRIIESAADEIARQTTLAKQALRQQVADIAVQGAEKILGRNIDKAANSDLVDKMIEEL